MAWFRIISAIALAAALTMVGWNRFAPDARVSAQAGPVVGSAIAHDVSPPLRSIPPRPRRGPSLRQIPIHVPPALAERHKPRPDVDDPLQGAPIIAATPPPLLTFEGLSDDDNAAVIGGRVVPPDTQGDVGPNHYVQWVNLIMAVYDKSGLLLFGPVPGNSIWTGFGGACETTNDGDPIVLHDHLADRWMISQFSVDAGTMCIAVSTSPDPTLSYNRYAFQVSPAGAFPDYPKLGVWPDGYYLSANEFAGSFQGAIAVVFERDAMLAGAPARFVRMGPLPCDAECYFSLQPSHLNGAAPPPGTPNPYVMAWDDETWGTGNGADGYRMFEFHVDWIDPLASTFTQLPFVVTAEFDANLCNFNACVPQMRGERLDTLSQFTMYRAQYRTIGTRSSIVLNHTVDAKRNLATIRWVELSKDIVLGGWSLARTGTLSAADGLHRWMGSAAMDKNGNIALGYTVSSGREFPSIRYVMIEAASATAGAEEMLQAGGGSQRSSFNRWGDYSTTSVDPVDGCTFWHTNEYYANTNSFDFKTRVGAFRSTDCF